MLTTRLRNKRRAKYVAGAIPKLRLTSIECHKAYESKYKKEYTPLTRTEFNNVVELYFSKIGDAMVQNSEGIHIKELGYFGVLEDAGNKNPAMGFEIVDGKKESNVLNSAHTEGRIYCLGFVPIDRRNVLLTWNMDYTFHNKIKSKLSYYLKAGFKYRFNASVFIPVHKTKEK